VGEEKRSVIREERRRSRRRSRRSRRKGGTMRKRIISVKNSRKGMYVCVVGGRGGV
jgi:hypothetical protein